MLIKMEIIGHTNPDIIVPYLETFRYKMFPSKSRYSLCRSELWFRRRWVGSKFIEVVEDNRITKFADRIYPGWQICCMYYGLGILPHRDHKIFGNEVVSVNLNKSLYTVDNIELELSAGEIVKFNSKSLHSVKSLNGYRYSICLWKLPEFTQLSLF